MMKSPLFRYQVGLVVALVCTIGTLLAATMNLDEIESLVRDQHYDQALSRLDQLDSASAEQAQALLLKGLALANSGQDRAAEKIYKELIEKHPRMPEGYNNLAAIYAQRGNLDLAKKTLEEGMRTHAGYQAVYENLSAIYVEIARNSYVQALQLGAKRTPPTLQTLANVGGLELPKRVVAAAPQRTPEPSTVASSAPAPTRVAAALPQRTETPQFADDGERFSQDDRQSVVSVLQSWARAWSNKDPKQYLSYYGREFNPDGNLSRRTWERSRRERITSPQWINVSLTDIEVNVLTPQRVTIELVQKYRSDTLSDDTRKQFTMMKSQGDWVILSEKSIETTPR